MSHYPASFPLVEIQSVVAAFRNHPSGSDKAAVAEDLWWITGYGMSLAFGAPVALAAAQDGQDPVALLEAAVAAHQAGAYSAQAVQWGVLLKWAAQQLLVLIGTLG